MIGQRVSSCMIMISLLMLPSSTHADAFIERLSDFFNLSLSSGQMRGSGDISAAGSIWVTDLEQKTTVKAAPDGNYRSPVFSSFKDGIFALKGDTLVRIEIAGRISEVLKAKNILRLIGFDSKDPDKILVLLSHNNSTLGILSLKTGNVSLVEYDPQSDSHKLVLDKIRGQERVLGATSVFVKKESRQGLSRIMEWTDVYVRRGNNDPVNISNCNGINCDQPAISPDGMKVAFVKAGG